jgi:hypothetical protein
MKEMKEKKEKKKKKKKHMNQVCYTQHLTMRQPCLTMAVMGTTEPMFLRCSQQNLPFCILV